MIPRPMPQREVLELDGWGKFVPSPELAEWVSVTLIDSAGALHNSDHEHLAEAHIGYLWTSAPCSSKGRTVVGMAEIPLFRCNKWQKGRQEQQIREWFGEIPDFIITLDAYYCQDASDIEFLSLIEHELYHCAQETDEFGTPKFKKETGLPTYAIAGHDVEEFVGVVRRYGAVNPAVQDLIIAAANKPEVGRLNIARGCGTCTLKLA